MTDAVLQRGTEERKPDAAVGQPRSAFRLERPLGLSELGLAWLALAVLGALAFAPLVRHGGFHLDDWSNGARALQPPGGPGLDHVLSAFSEIALFRPVLIVYVPLTYFIFSMHMGLHLAWAATLAVAVSALLYGVLRALGVPWVHAFFIAALVLLFPWFDATRFWVTGAQVSLSITFMLGGLWIALTGLSRRSWSWHSAAAVLYLISILTYEITLPVIATIGVIYVWRAGWREAKLRWGVDLVVAAIGAIWVGSHTVRTTSGFADDIAHLKEIIDGGATIVGRTAIPFGAEHTPLALLCLGVVFALALAALLVLPGRFSKQPGWGLRSWLLLGAGGLALAVFGWVIFIPADPYYTPTIYGLTNRVNGLAGIGAVIAVYAGLGLVGTLVGQVLPKVRAVPLAITLLLATVLSIGYLQVIKRHTGIWNSAYVSEAAALTEIKSQYPRLPSGTTLFASGYPAYQTLGVPILSATWDLDGMVKTSYQDGTLAAYPIISGFSLSCSSNGVSLESEGVLIADAPYGSARMLDLATGERSLPRNRRDCRAVVGDYVPGPLYLSYSY